MENIGKKNKTLIIIGSIAGCSIVVFCCILIFVIATASFALSGQQSPEGVVISIEVPEEVQLGDTFDILIKIENTQVEPQNLIAISFVMDYLFGIEIIESDPTFSYQNYIEILEIPMKILSYSEMILENEVLDVHITAETIQVGDFLGEIQICLNGPTNCERIPIRTKVVDN